eukprot:1151008-Pleurochrysis_carterae.AAC.2
MVVHLQASRGVRGRRAERTDFDGEKDGACKAGERRMGESEGRRAGSLKIGRVASLKSGVSQDRERADKHPRGSGETAKRASTVDSRRRPMRQHLRARDARNGR